MKKIPDMIFVIDVAKEKSLSLKQENSISLSWLP